MASTVVNDETYWTEARSLGKWTDPANTPGTFFLWVLWMIRAQSQERNSRKSSR
jgi:hypothetical protein